MLKQHKEIAAIQKQLKRLEAERLKLENRLDKLLTTKASGPDHSPGVYPMLSDGTCWFLAADFDKQTWQRDAEAYLATCRSKQVPSALGRELSPSLINRLIRLTAFQNPSFYRAQAMRLSTFGIPRVIACGELLPYHIALPRGSREEMEQLFKELNIYVSINEERCIGHDINTSFLGELTSEQEAAAKALLAHETGVLAATTAFGKTVTQAYERKAYPGLQKPWVFR